MPTISTMFDKPLEEDIALETKSTSASSIVDTLKNAENTYKAFLYLRAMYSLYPNKETILKMDTVKSDDYVEIDKPVNANRIFVVNTGDGSCYIKFNDEEFEIVAGKEYEFPVIPKTDENDGDKVEVKGTLSYYMKNVQEF